ncbi:MAG: hypothetical protein KBONHNOK_00598 [Candidatus Methanoperedenaceae archaeon GB50]|nr:MAG: hypothetical protein KBONHNOK_00598 [Candidatus Methanoperedenaceae archaeon GB50]
MRRIIGALIVVGILVVIPAGVQAQRSDTPVDTVYVPAFGPKDTGSIVYSSIILEKDCKYKIVVSGVYQFNVNMDYGYADAQYRMDSSGQYTQRFNSIEFNGERVNADISDIDDHRYTFYWIGDGNKVKFSIYDYVDNKRGTYDDNAGTLKVEIYPITSLSLGKSVSPHSIKQGQETTVTLTVENTGTTEITDIEVVDTIPSDLTFVSGETSKRYASLRPKDSREFQYTLQLNEPGTYNLDPATATYADEEGNYHTVTSETATIEVIPSLITTPTQRPTPRGTSTASVHLYGEKTDVVLGEDVLLKLSAVNIIGNPTMHVQVIIIPPSGWSVTSSEFATSGTGQYTTTYDIEPGVGRDIEVRIRPNQIGDDFEVQGRIIYYFEDDPTKREDHTLTLPIKVRAKAESGVEQTESPPESNGSSTPGFAAVVTVAGVLAVYLWRKRR